LLDREEALAIHRISASAERLGDELFTALDLRGQIRSHPLLAAGLGAFLGFVGGPLVLRGLEGTLNMASTVLNPASPQTRTIQDLVRGSLRFVRPRR
jgi:hypothetical protein